MSHLARFAMKIIRKIDDPLHKLRLIGDHWWQTPGRIVCDLYDWDVGGPPAKWIELNIATLREWFYG